MGDATRRRRRDAQDGLDSWSDGAGDAGEGAGGGGVASEGGDGLGDDDESEGDDGNGGLSEEEGDGDSEGVDDREGGVEGGGVAVEGVGGEEGDEDEEGDDVESGDVAVEVMGGEGKLGRSCSPSRADGATSFVEEMTGDEEVWICDVEGSAWRGGVPSEARVGGVSTGRRRVGCSETAELEVRGTSVEARPAS